VKLRPSAGSLAFLAAGFVLGLVALRLFDHFSPTSGTEDAIRTFSAALNVTHDRYVERDKTDPEELVHDAISGMIDGLGDTGHSRFLSAEQRRRDAQALKGTLVGIGVEMAERDGHTVVAAVYPESPAAKAGLRAGDRLVRIEGEDVAGLNLAQLGERLRGPAGTELHITALHPDNTVTDVTVRREEIRIPFVSWAPIAGSSLWHIRITQFGDGTAGDLDKALNAARSTGATGIVLDLRDNPGGLLDEAVAVISRFVPSGVALLERDRSNNTKPINVKTDAPHTDLPVVLLINGGSASAAEVTASALLFHGRALAVGEKTFGTATVLQTFGLPDGSAILLGVREWLTPAGQPLRKVGVTPTETVPLPAPARALTPLAPDSPPEQPCTASDQQLRIAATRLGLACAAA
jgi:carboxyl-terminal processing protease